MAAFERLFENDGIDEREEEKIQINKSYAKKYHKFKEFQELDKLKQKYGDVALNESDESSEEEDEDAEALTPQLEADFMKTLSMIKSKDPKIYNKKSEFYKDEDDSTEHTTSNKSKKQKEKPVFLKDYERQRLLEKGSKAYLSDSDSDNDESYFKQTKKPLELTYNEEQEQIKKSFKMMDSSGDSDDDGNDGGNKLLQLREKSSQEKAEEDAEYKSWLKKEGKSRDTLGQYWKNDKLDENEKFLRDYILNRQFVAGNTEGVPSHNEVVVDLDSDEDEEEEAELEREEEFERKFNFRYEEPDQDFIKKYPRTIAESVRRVDDGRKVKRKERNERKSKEKDKKKEELKRLKNLKRKEIMEKIEKLKAITGNDKVGFLEDDMDGDFDASNYDQLMGSVFDDDYYDVDEEEEKPQFSDDDEGFLPEENWDDWTGERDGYDYVEEEAYEPHCEDENFNMDADFIDTKKTKSKQQQWDMYRNENKTKRNSKFVEALQRKKPVFDPNERTFEEYFDEYYKLDFEDIISDMPVRFKYRNVVSNDYGLSTSEVLQADDKELNEWCSLKRTIRYNTDAEEKIERQKYKRKGRNWKKKERVFPSLKKKENQDNEQESFEGDFEVINVFNGSSHTKNNSTTTIKETNTSSSTSHNLHAKSQRGFKKKTLNSKFSVVKNRQPKLRSSMWKKNNTASTMSNTKQKKLLRRFRGVDAKTMGKISVNRLDAYGLDKRKKKEEQ